MRRPPRAAAAATLSSEMGQLFKHTWSHSQQQSGQQATSCSLTHTVAAHKQVSIRTAFTMPGLGVVSTGLACFVTVLVTTSQGKTLHCHSNRQCSVSRPVHTHPAESQSEHQPSSCNPPVGHSTEVSSGGLVHVALPMGVQSPPMV
jgi:hypothetical protein